MSKGHGLICFDCKSIRNQFGMTIRHMGKVMGHVCIKCSKKREVQDRPHGMGWRKAFQMFAEQILKRRAIINQQIDHATLTAHPPVGRAV